MISVAVAVTLACHRLLRRGLVPLLVLLLLVWIAFALGVFDGIVASYEARGMEESGRFLVWPLAIARWMAAPFTGVGAFDVATFVPAKNKFITPHNSFIFVGLASGIIPFVFFLMDWIQALRGALRLRATPILDAPFCLPLIAYSLLTSLVGGLTFMMPWMIVVLTAAVAAGAARGPAAARRPQQSLSLFELLVGVSARLSDSFLMTSLARPAPPFTRVCLRARDVMRRVRTRARSAAFSTWRASCTLGDMNGSCITCCEAWIASGTGPRSPSGTIGLMMSMSR